MSPREGSLILPPVLHMKKLYDILDLHLFEQLISSLLRPPTANTFLHARLHAVFRQQSIVNVIFPSCPPPSLVLLFRATFTVLAQFWDPLSTRAKAVVYY